MKTGGIRTVLRELAPEKEFDIALAFFRWGYHPILFSALPSEAELAGFVSDFAQFRQRLTASDGNSAASAQDRTIVLTEYFRGMKQVQRQGTGPWLNSFLKASLSPDVFDLWYRAAGLDPLQIGYGEWPGDITICLCDFGSS